MLTRSAIGVGSLLLFSAALFGCASSTSGDTGTVLDGAVAPQDSGTGDDSTVADSAAADTYIAFDTGTTGPGTGPTSCSQTNGTFGCCGPNGENYYCGADAGTVSSKNCAAEVTDAGTALVCGWNATKGYYGCVPPPAMADPSGAEPLACGAGAGDGGTDSGTPSDAGSDAEAPGDSSTPGDSGAPSEAGGDSGPPADSGTPTDGGSIPTTCAQADNAVGCCGPNGENYYCSASSTTVTAKTCTGTKVCGWSATNSYYECVAGPATADPSGTYPIACK